MTTKQLSVVVQAVDRMTAQVATMQNSLVRFGTTADREGRRADGAFTRIARSVISLRGVLTGFVGVYTARRLFGSFADAARQIDDVGKSAQRLGLSVEMVGQLTYAAKLANVPFEELGDSAQRAAANINKFVSGGSGGAADTLRRLGVPLTDATGRVRDLNELLPELGERLSRIPDESERIRRSVELFGRNGQAALRVFNSELGVAREEARRLGVLFGPEQIAAAEAFNDAVDRVGAAWLGLRANLVLQVGPALADVLNQVASFVAAVPEIAGNAVGLIRDAFAGDQFYNQASGGIMEVMGRMAELVREGVYRIMRGGAAAMFDGFHVLLKTLGPVAHGFFVELILSPLAGVMEVVGDVLNLVSPGIADKFKEDLARGMADNRGLVLENFAENLDKNFTALYGSSAFVKEWSDGVDAIEPRVHGLTAALNDLLGISEAIAKTSLDGLVSPRFKGLLKGDVEDERTGYLAGVGSHFEDLERQVADTFNTGRKLAADMTGTVVDGLTPAILDVATGAAKAKDAFRDFARSTLRSLSEVITKMLLLRAVSAIGNAFFSGATTAAAPSAGAVTGEAQFYGGSTIFANQGGYITPLGKLQRFFGGGEVQGPDLGRDSVLAAVRPREVVLNPDAVSRAGVKQLLHFNRGGALGPVPAAAGGHAGVGGPLINVQSLTIVVQGASGAGGGEAVGQRTASEFVRGFMAQLRNMPGARDELRAMVG